MLTQARLKELLHYDPDTGIFTWKDRCGGRIKIGSVAGGPHIDGYQHIRVRGKRLLSHRLAFLYMSGAFPTLDVDHINHKRNDNRWVNLRVVNRRDNRRNSRVAAHNTSGTIGVSYHKRDKRWQAYITGHTGRRHLGYFATLEEATTARAKANLRYNYHPNHGKT